MRRNKGLLTGWLCTRCHLVLLYSYKYSGGGDPVLDVLYVGEGVLSVLVILYKLPRYGVLYCTILLYGTVVL